MKGFIISILLSSTLYKAVGKLGAISVATGIAIETTAQVNNGGNVVNMGFMFPIVSDLSLIPSPRPVGLQVACSCDSMLHFWDGSVWHINLDSARMSRMGYMQTISVGSSATRRVVTISGGNSITIPQENYDSLLNKPLSASYQATPSDPTGTTNGTGVMMGLAGSVTPTKSGKILIVVSANIANGATGGGAQTQLRYGTGSAPANAAALTGTSIGNIATIVNPLLALLAPGSGNATCSAIVSGLTLNTAYWIDLSLARITSNTATLTNISISIIEL